MLFAPLLEAHGQNVGLQVRYVEKPEFALVAVLVFLPSQDVVRGFVAVCIEIITNLVMLQTN